MQGVPAVRYGLRRLLGRTAADLLLNVPNLVALALSGNPLGLAVTGAESVRLLTEVVARRGAWKAYEARIGGVAAAHAGAVIRLEAGERTPLAARVIEGIGIATGDDALPLPVVPDGMIPAGARLFGGPFVVELQGGESFTPAPPALRPPRPRSTTGICAHWGPVSLGYAALTAVITRSPARTFASLLLVSPRTAMIGAESADLGASARVLRAGVIIVGTRPQRTIRRADLLLVDGPRTLTDGFELARRSRSTTHMIAAGVLERATQVACGGRVTVGWRDADGGRKPGTRWPV